MKPWRIEPIRLWFQTRWPHAGHRRRVLAEYAKMRKLPLAMADIAIRGQVNGCSHVPGDPYTTAFNEGRRALALEILELAKLNADDVDRIFKSQPRPTP